MAAALAIWSPTAVGDSLEDAVKATYLYKLVPFITWPEEARQPAAGAVNLCVVGSPAFAVVLKRAVQDQRNGGGGFAVLQPAVEATDASGCHVLFATSADQRVVDSALWAVRGRPVFTVTDGGDGTSARGMLHFVISEGRVRFEIDERMAAASGLDISSKLLSLATAVRRRDG